MNDHTAEAELPTRARDPFRAALRILGAVALAAAAWLARDVLFLAFFAVIIAIVFSFPVSLLARLVPRGLAVLLMLLLGAGVAVGIGAIAAPTLTDQYEEMRETAPRAIQEARRWVERARASIASAGGAPQGGAQPGSGGGGGGNEALARAGERGLKALFGVVGALTEIVLVIVLAAFLVHEPGIYHRGVRRLVPPAREATFDELWSRLRDGLRRWVGGISISMVIMGALTAAGLLVALAQSPHHLLLAAAVYLGVHLVEGYIVQPLIMRRAVEIKPALLLVGQSLFGGVFGLMGVVIATPALVCIQVAVEYLWVERRLGKAEA